jgi:predicted AlkP superfamily phosphohydrolase/phosphomutase
MLPTLPLPNWASFWTGESPTRHGIFAFAALGENGITSRMADRRHLKRPTWLDITSSQGLRIVSVYAPLTYPSNLTGGVIVSDRAGQVSTNPPELEHDIRTQFDPLLVPRYKQFLPPHGFSAFEDVRRFIQGQIKSVRQTMGLTKYLIEKGTWDAAIVDVFATDPIQHALWHGVDLKHPAFESKLHHELGLFFSALDSSVGELIDAASPSGVLIFSSHGFTSTRRILNLARSLSDSGVLRPLRLVERAWKRARRKSRLLSNPIRQPWMVTGDHRHSIYLDDKAIYIFHPPGGSQPLVQKVSQILQAVEDPATNTRPICQVHYPQAHRHTSHAGRRSVLILEFAEGETARRGSLTGPLFKTCKANDDYLIGTHTGNGLWAFSGDGIANTDDEHATILDLPPTILQYLGLAVPYWMERPGLLM